jgi:exodeoxyribonuclease VII large subunit
MQVLNVEQVATYLKDVLESEPLLQDLWVRGEVSNLSRSASGHTYFTVKDAVSQLKCVLFRHLARYQTQAPANGVQMILHGHVSLYEATGTLQLYVDLVQPDGVGAAALQFELLRRRLADEGLFDESRKRPLPAYPTCIGVVTSAHGAVWHDIITIINRRYPAVTLVLSPAQVQGDQAAASLVEALHRLWEYGECDLIIVGRGGGSAEDLAAFNDERVARAIYASPVPVISAVGHELDVTIADLVADVRAPTPSAAAELAVPDRRQLLADLAALHHRLRDQLAERLADERAALRQEARHLAHLTPRVSLRQQSQRLDDLAERLAGRVRATVERQRQALTAVDGRLRALDPAAVLGRGYAVVTHATTNAVISAASAVRPGELLRVRVRDGQFTVTVACATAGEAP